jgi:hypothetical protein
MTLDECAFVSESVRYARTLPYTGCLQYLRGMLKACGDLDALGDVREIVQQLSDSDAQLELIASGQLKLNLEPAVTVRRRQPSRRS